MKILVIGSEVHFSIISQKLGDKPETSFAEDVSLALHEVKEYDYVFDFLIDESPENFDAYNQNEDQVIFLNTPKTSLAEIRYIHGEFTCKAIGFNGMPGFFEKDKWEVSLLNNDQEFIDKAFRDLGQEYLLVQDRVGMVTPRIKCMIINEAYYTVQEGTASKEDINMGMKLGTNYPEGPFEWVEEIGIKNVFEILEAVYEDTKDERYKICPLLKREYLITQS